MKSQLAIHGGAPVRDTFLPYGRQIITDEDVNSVVQVLKSDWLTTGPTITEFEECFAEYVGADYAVALSNGTAALHAAAYAAGINQESDVITTPMTFAATANSIRYQNGRVLFADIDENTLNISVDKVADLITKKTKAIFPVDFGGLPIDYDELQLLADENQIPIIVDAAHALGATYKGKRVGSLATMNTFSFHPVKHITTGEGGMVTTNDLMLANKIRSFRNHGINHDHKQRSLKVSWIYEIDDIGYNYRLTDFQCALGLSQMKNLDLWLERRKTIAQIYSSSLASIPEITIPPTLGDRDSAWHLYVIKLNLELLRVDRTKIFEALRAENIGVNVHYIPVPIHPYYRKLGYDMTNLPVAQKSYSRILSLPMWAGMTDIDVQHTIEAVFKVISHYRI